MAALVPLACRDIVFKKAARMGDVRQTDQRAERPAPRPERRGQIAGLAKKAALWARQKGHPEAVAVAMVDPDAEIVEAKDSQTGASRLILRSELEAEPGRYQVIQTRKEPGSVLTVSGRRGRLLRPGPGRQRRRRAQGLYGLRGRAIRVDGPGWVDSLVTILTDPYVSWLLLFVGVFMLVIELKLPGIGLPAIISALAFLLFFWSHYLSGTADQLEIILFLIGLVCLALEIFVFPGFGVFGMSGILLMLCSIVLASHTFIWPTQDYEYQELGHTLLQVTGMLVAVGGCAVVLARYFPSLPLFNRLILKPEPWTRVEAEDASGRPVAGGLRIARLPDRRDRADDLAAAADRQGAVRQPADRRHRRRLLRRARQPGRGRRRPGAAGHRQESRRADRVAGRPPSDRHASDWLEPDPAERCEPLAMTRTGRLECSPHRPSCEPHSEDTP